MRKYSIEELEMAQKAILSSIHKNEKAKETLSHKKSSQSPQMSIVSRSLDAFYIASSLIAKELEQEDTCNYSKGDLESTIQTMLSINRRVERLLPKLQKGTSQHTLSVRRINAHNIAIDLMKREMKN